MIKGDGGCSGAPAPTLMCRTASASLTKCGYDEFSGYASTPPKVYRTMTQTGTLTINYGAQNGSTTTWSGGKTYDRSTCNVTDTRAAVAYDALQNCTLNISAGNPYCDVTISDVTTNGSTYMISSLAAGSCNAVSTLDNAASASFTATVQTSTAGTNFSGVVTATLSNEYTTAQLWTDTINAIPAYSGAYSSNCIGAYASLSTNQKTASGRKLQWYFQLPDLTGFGGYKVTWDVIVTPDAGGSNVYDSGSYVWNGTDTTSNVLTIGDLGTQLDQYQSLYGNCTISIGNVVASVDC